jgi:hypothetical protein
MKLSDTLKIRIEPELKTEIAVHAASLGHSLAWYVRQCVKAAIATDRLRAAQARQFEQADGTRPQDGTR